jgi:uncharacterized protein (DUF58 family)
MPKTTYALRVVLVLLALSLMAGAITGNRLYYRLSYLWGVLLGLSWLMSTLSLRGVFLQRNARVLRSSAGQIFEERYEIINSGRLPRLWIEVRDESPLPGSHGSHVLTLIGGRESRTYLARARLAERGVFPLGPTVLASGDIFGLFPVNRRFESQHSLLVYPMMVHVENFPSPPGLLPGGEALRRRTPQITSNAAGVREYEPGDPLNRIHWVSTARRNRLMVKEFELDPLAEVWIFIDAERAAQAIRPSPTPEFDPRDVWRKRFEYQLPPSTLEYGVTIAASLARYYLQRRRAVGMAYAGPMLRILPPDRGGRQLGKMLEALALLRGEGFMPLHSLVETQARHLPRGSTVVMITPSSSELVYKAADMITRRGLRPVVMLVDAATFGGYHSPDALVGPLQMLGVPYSRISEGDDLSVVLSSAVGSPQWS